MSKLKNYFFPLVLISGILLFLATAGLGCKGLSSTEQQLVAPVTLEYWTVVDDVDAINNNIAAYKANGRPYLTVNVRQLRASEFYQRLIEALAEDRGPDIISVSNRMMNGYLSKIVPMPASVTDAQIFSTQTTLGTNTTVQANTVPMVTPIQIEREYVKVVKDDAVIGGQVYGLPLSLDTLAVYFNKDLLDRVGIAVPPKDWVEFQAGASKISRFDRNTDKVLQSGAALGTGNNIDAVDDILYVLFRQSGVPFSASNGRAQFNGNGSDPNGPAMSVINFYTNFANPTRDSYGWNKDMGLALDEFVSGKVGFMIGYSYQYPLIKARAPQLNIGVLPLFQIENRPPINVANYYLQTVTAKSKHKNEAWALINYLAHSQATKTYLDASGRPTALRAYIGSQKENLAIAPFVDQVLVAENWYRGTNYEPAAQAISDMVDMWLTVPSGVDKEAEIRQNILNNAAAKINQTL